MRSLLHTSHPGLAAALRRDRNWTQVSARLFGDNKLRSVASIQQSSIRRGFKYAEGAGCEGHFRAVQGFRYLGPVLPS